MSDTETEGESAEESRQRAAMAGGHSSRPRLVIIGRQGAGKGTQCELLSAHYGIPHLSTGDVLRAAVADDTPLGQEAKDYMDAGNLLPDELITGIVSDRIGPQSGADGFLLDGFPRTTGQAEALLEMTQPRGIGACVNLDVPVDEVRARMLARSREDDTPEAIDRRLELYERETSPLLAWFDDQDLLLTCSGLGDVDEIAQRIITAIDTYTAG